MNPLLASTRTVLAATATVAVVGVGPHRGDPPGPRAAAASPAARPSPVAVEVGAPDAPGTGALAVPRVALTNPGVPGGDPRPDSPVRSSATTSPARDRYYDFHFTRAVYSSGGLRFGFRSRSWATDFPKADRQFLIVLGKTLDLLEVPDRENAVRLDDPDLRRFPFLYMLEVGYMSLTEEEVRGLRSYLRAGGFLVVDDFWGRYEWRNFAEQMRRVFPERPIEEISLDHPIFHSFYDINEIIQVPNVGNARAGGRTTECAGCEAQVRAIFDDQGRLMAIINFNTDLGDAWEWSEQPFYPFQYSNFAYKMAVNFIVYSMTH